MKMTGTRTVPAPIETVWSALNDPAMIKSCVPGCESIEASTENTYRMVVAQQVGPVSARFTGTMSVLDAQPPTAYVLRFNGTGAAGFVKGEARVSLAPAGARATTLAYEAEAQIGGKLAQVGSRLVDAVAAKQADDFFTRFSTLMDEQTTPAIATPAPVAAPQGRLPMTAGIAIVVAVLALAGWLVLR
jgi:carbon monoxide dehydrogenase subunit G